MKMKIKVDEEAKKMIEALCDIALKVGGTQNLKGVNDIIAAIEDYEPTE